MVLGEIWRARTDEGPLYKGQRVRVKGRDKFTLLVEPISKSS
jgi:membrane protein implicated in regulation of membrane protease activity